jgi:hypothetical protein
VFTGPYADPRVVSPDYGIQNAMPQSAYPQLTFGLSQAAEINGRAAGEMPVNASSVLATRFAILSQAPIVYAWLHSTVASSTVIDRVGSDAVTVDFSSDDTQTLIYDPELGRFVRKPAAIG